MIDRAPVDWTTTVLRDILRCNLLPRLQPSDAASFRRVCKTWNVLAPFLPRLVVKDIDWDRPEVPAMLAKAQSVQAKLTPTTYFREAQCAVKRKEQVTLLVALLNASPSVKTLSLASSFSASEATLLFVLLRENKHLTELNVFLDSMDEDSHESVASLCAW